MICPREGGLLHIIWLTNTRIIGPGIWKWHLILPSIQEAHICGIWFITRKTTHNTEWLKDGLWEQLSICALEYFLFFEITRCLMTLEQPPLVCPKIQLLCVQRCQRCADNISTAKQPAFGYMQFALRKYTLISSLECICRIYKCTNTWTM